MADIKPHKRTAAPDVPENAIGGDSATEQQPATRWEYVGPHYGSGLVLPGFDRKVVPHKLTQQEIEQLVTQNPYKDFAKFWKQVAVTE